MFILFISLPLSNSVNYWVILFSLIFRSSKVIDEPVKDDIYFNNSPKDQGKTGGNNNEEEDFEPVGNIDHDKSGGSEGGVDGQEAGKVEAVTMRSKRRGRSSRRNTNSQGLEESSRIMKVKK